MTILDFVRITRANALVIFAMFSLGLLAAFVYTLRQPVIYTAASKGYVVANTGNSINEVFSASSLAQQKLAVYAGLTGSTRVAQDVIDELHLTADPGDIAGRFSAVASPGIPELTVFASAGSPTEARDLANAVIGALSKEAAQLEGAARPAGAPVSTLVKLVPTEQAAAPSAPTSPNYQKNLLAGAGLGILLGYALSFLRRQLDRKIRTVDDMEELVGAAVLSIIPESDDLDRIGQNGLLSSHTGPAAESLRTLRTNLRFVDVDHPPRSIVVTSANAGEGKSVVTANLARVLAAAGQPTVLVDGDLRRPMVATLFDLDPTVGLTQVLAGDLPLADVVLDAGVPNLRIIVAGRIPPNPSELLGSQRMQALIRELVDQGYHVLIDAPPLLPVTDAGLVSGIVDGAILVLAVGRTYKEQARLAAKVLSQVGGHVLGSVLNRAPLRGIGSVVYGYGYGGYYGGDYYQAGYSSRQEPVQKRRGLLSRRKTRESAESVTNRLAKRAPSRASGPPGADRSHPPEAMGESPQPPVPTHPPAGVGPTQPPAAAPSFRPLGGVPGKRRAG